jgi:hypothetical protein
MCRNS